MCRTDASAMQCWRATLNENNNLIIPGILVEVMPEVGAEGS